MARKTEELRVGRRPLQISNPDKVLYPETGFTKRQVIDYYRAVAGVLLPHLKNRPVTLKRFPDGVTGKSFYEKNAPRFTPDWVATHPVPRRSGGRDIRYVLVNDAATLVWVANLASLELHPFLHRARNLQRPTHVVFDLDPGEGTDVLTCADVAFLLKDVLERLGLESWPKVSGSKGIQVYVPLNSAASYETTGPFARAVADLLAREHPDRIGAVMRKALRRGKVFIDWSQNSEHKTTVSVYSLRAKRERPFVSLPVRWEELDRARRAGEPDQLYFGPEDALERIKKLGDLFEPVLKRRQHLPRKFLEAVSASASRRPATGRSGKGPLAGYQSRRDFARTAEPPPRAVRRRAARTRRFVVQKHAASRLHYDFRLEMGGVLKSWAVPKGLPYEQGRVRGAFQTEDHPLDYIDFEGVIPRGQYGGGTVMVWDTGSYELVDGNYGKGQLLVRLNGKKLRGEWKLVRKGGADAKAEWLLIKAHEDARPPGARAEAKSVLSGRTLEQIARAPDSVWESAGGS